MVLFNSKEGKYLKKYEKPQINLIKFSIDEALLATDIGGVAGSVTTSPDAPWSLNRNDSLNDKSSYQIGE